MTSGAIPSQRSTICNSTNAGIVLQRFAANANRLRFAARFDHRSVRFDLRALLDVLGALRFLLLDHLGFDGVFQFLREADVLNHEVFDHQQAGELLAARDRRRAF